MYAAVRKVVIPARTSVVKLELRSETLKKRSTPPPAKPLNHLSTPLSAFFALNLPPVAAALRFSGDLLCPSQIELT